MAIAARWTTAELEGLPEPLDGTRYEIVDGELYVTTQPSWQHQVTCANIVGLFHAWNEQTRAGVVAIAPGVVFSPDNAVAPDLVWVSRERLPLVLGEDRKLHDAPDLVVEVLSPGAINERRDRETKLTLYSRQGVREYWIVDWQQRTVAIYRRADTALQLAATLLAGDQIDSPLLPGFSCPVARCFAGID
jgi:Uma2 family endonuclease